MAGQSNQDTVSSTEPNISSGAIRFSLQNQSVVKHCEVVDLPGHFNFRQKLREEQLARARAVMILLDSKAKEQF